MRRPTAVDLFSGPGGLSLGLGHAGFRVIHAIEKEPCAVATYERNHGPHVRAEEIGFGTALPEADIIAGGPPCQGFTSAGARRRDDARNTLVSVYASLIARHKPKAFLFENVEGFLTLERGAFVIDLLRPLVAAGYRVRLVKANAANYGVPQHRKRVLVVGGLGWTPDFPPPTHFAFGAPGAARIGAGLTRAVTVATALAGLPSPGDPGSPSDHHAATLTDRDIDRISRLSQGQKMADLPADLQHDSYARRANRRVSDGTPSERRGGAPTGIRRLIADEPCKAITSAATAEFIHPVANRFLTLRECARIQTFPDNYEFLGTIAERAVMIGDAVPPLLAEHVAAALRPQIATARVGDLPGALVQFTPTNATGVSDALRTTIDRVHAEFGRPLPLFEEARP